MNRVTTIPRKWILLRPLYHASSRSRATSLRDNLTLITFDGALTGKSEK